MKKNLFTSAILAVVVAVGWQPANAQLRLPPASSSQTVTQSLGISSVTLTYNRPNVNGREIFGGLEPYGNVWRTGANNIPILTFDGAVTIAGTLVEAGTYGLLTIPGTDEWTIIFSKNSKQWGAYTYNEEEDLFRFTVQPKQLEHSVETFTMAFSDVTPNSAKLNISWENTKIGFDLLVDHDAEIMTSID